MFFISEADIFKFLENLGRDYEVFVPVKKGRQRFYQKFSPGEKDSADFQNLAIGEVRAFEPLKAFFLAAREAVAENFEPKIPHVENKPSAIIGVKACDLKGFKVHDFVFKNHDFKDPIYLKKREQNLIIASDCTLAIETCFCLALGLKPYPEDNYDLNFSGVASGFLVETGSARGEGLIRQMSQIFKNAESRLETERGELRKRVIALVEQNINDNQIPRQDSLNGVIEKKYEADIWADEAKTCVECGACNTICPTCHCFLLADQKNQEKMIRGRLWDSCLLKDFARVAGGANPRPKLWMRLRNRFEKKFDFFPKVAGFYACTGCGRCISACPAKIDIRKVLKRLVENAS